MPRNRCKPIFETLYITSFFLICIHTMLLRDVESHRTSISSLESPLKFCAGKKRKHYGCEHMPPGHMDVGTTEIDPNDYWMDFSGEGQVHKFFVYMKVVDECNKDNVFFKYVDSTLSIKLLKNKILMHANKDLKTRISLRVKIDKCHNMLKRVDLSDSMQHKTKHNKSLQDVIAKFDTEGFLLGGNRMFQAVINWSIRR